MSHVKVRFLKFYVALAAFVAFAVLASGLRGSWLAAIFGWGLLAMGVYFRQRLRGIFGHAKGTVQDDCLGCLGVVVLPVLRNRAGGQGGGAGVHKVSSNSCMTKSGHVACYCGVLSM